MRIKDIMNEEVQTITEDLSAEDAWNRMNLHQIHHLVVVRGKDVIGVVSERDLGGKCGGSVCDGRLVSDLVTTDIITAEPDMTVKEAANLLRGYSIGCLPVFKDEKLIGIVTISDLLELVGRGLDRSILLKERKTGVDMPSYTRND